MHLHILQDLFCIFDEECYLVEDIVKIWNFILPGALESVPLRSSAFPARPAKACFSIQAINTQTTFHNI